MFSLFQSLQEAEALLNQGQIAAAERTLTPIIHHPAAQHLQGVICLHSQRSEQAAEYWSQALELGADISLHLELAQLYVHLERFPLALKHFDLAKTLDIPFDDPAEHRLALTLHACEKFTKAQSQYEQVLLKHPRHGSLWMQYANVLADQGIWSEAQTAYDRAAELIPEDPLIRYNLARLAYLQGQYPLALSHLKRLNLARDHSLKPTVLQLQATLLKAIGELTAAQQICEEWIQVSPQQAEAHNLMGAILQAAHQGEAAEQHYRQALALEPQTQTQLNLAQLMRERGQATEAVRLLRELSAQWAPARYPLAFVLPPVFESQAALAIWQQHLQVQLQDLEDWPLSLQDPLQSVGPLPYYLPYLGLDDLKLNQQLARLMLKACPALAETPALTVPAMPPSERKRLGIISGFWREHTVMHLFAQHLPELAAHFDLHLISTGQQQDALTEDLKNHYQLHLLPRDWQTARQEIVDLQLDLVLYFDLNLDPMTWYLACARLAPIQAMTWGHGITSGLPSIDYFISSEHLDNSPEAYSESLIQLPGLMGWWQLPNPDNTAEFDPAEFDLPGHAPLYLCPQSLYKLHPDFDACLSGILAADPEAHLVLIEGLYPEWRQILEQRWKAWLDPQRVHWLPRQSPEAFLRLLQCGSVMLDPFPFGGGLTAMQAFSVGLGVVTLPGTSLKGRIALAVARQLNWEAGIAENTADYIQRAVQVAQQGRDPDLAQHYAQTIPLAQGILSEALLALKVVNSPI